MTIAAAMSDARNLTSDSTAPLLRHPLDPTISSNHLQSRPTDHRKALPSRPSGGVSGSHEPRERARENVIVLQCDRVQKGATSTTGRDKSQDHSLLNIKRKNLLIWETTNDSKISVSRSRERRSVCHPIVCTRKRLVAMHFLNVTEVASPIAAINFKDITVASHDVQARVERRADERECNSRLLEGSGRIWNPIDIGRAKVSACAEPDLHRTVACTGHDVLVIIVVEIAHGQPVQRNGARHQTFR